jgi:B12-binding domain/radical SAM domain protein
MPHADLILLHPPSVYDFRKRTALYGPISDVVPSTPIYEMYPIGFMTIAEYLERHGHSVRIINVAMKMLKSRRFEAERLIESLKPLAFGIDLHWLAHAQGSLEIAGIVKKYHPHIPVIFGGLSASYYHEELVRYPQVDYVVRGDCAEEPLRQLIEKIKRGEPPDGVPNVTWRNGSSEVQVNEITHTSPHLNNISFDYRRLMKSSVRYRDLIGHSPFLGWFNYHSLERVCS